jgi:hypothetical protein
MRLYELAGVLGIPNRELLGRVRTLGIAVNNHMSSLSDADVVAIRQSVGLRRDDGPRPPSPAQPAIFRRRASGDLFAPRMGNPLAPPAQEVLLSARVHLLHVLAAKAHALAGEAGEAAPLTLRELAYRCTELRDRHGNPQAVLVEYSPEESRHALAKIKDLDLVGDTSWQAGAIGAAVVDTLASLSAPLAGALQAGQLFQVVGTPTIVQGLNSGALALMTTADGMLGTVVSTSTNKIAGQARFATASLAPVLVPVIAWQVLHAIAGSAQLKQLNLRLDTLQRRVEQLHLRQDATVLGEVRHALRVLDDIEGEHMTTGVFSDAMLGRLALAERTIGSTVERNQLLVEVFRAQADRAKRLGSTAGAATTAALLHEQGSQVRHDMELLVAVCNADLRVERALLLHAMDRAPADLPRRLARVAERVEAYREVLEHLPSLSELGDHAARCVEDMGWWRRNVFARSVAKHAGSVGRLDLRDVAVGYVRATDDHAPSYVFWKDDNARLHVRALPGIQVAPDDRRILPSAGPGATTVVGDDAAASSDVADQRSSSGANTSGMI